MDDVNHLFTSLDTRLDEKIISFIDNASKSIDIAIFIFEWKPIADALIRASERGIIIRLLTDIRSCYLKIKPQNSKNQLSCKNIPMYLLSKPNIEIFVYDNRPYIMHHKFMIIDSDTIITGSYNYQERATTGNRENILISKDEFIIQQHFNEVNFLIEMSSKLDLERSHLCLEESNILSEIKKAVYVFLSEYRFVVFSVMIMSFLINVIFLMVWVFNLD